MTLRVRLTIALVILVGIGLIAADVATYTALRSFLVQRVDQQLRSSPEPMLFALQSPDFHHGPPGGGPASALPPGTYGEIFDANGTSVNHISLSYGGPPLAAPDLPKQIPAGTAEDPALFTVGAKSGGPSYRVLAITGNDGSTLVVAIPLTELARTLSRLLVVAGLVTLAVLAAMGVLSWWTVRKELTPLERIEVTAGAIAAGDLSQRVQETDPRTEVGRLGVSLNAMLSRIEEAMQERLAAEDALRRFLADASHELRTPLTSIRGYAELFRRGADASADDTALAMRRIEQEGERMGVLVDDLLFLARAGQGRPILHEPVDLVPMATDAVHDARAVDPSREIALEVPETLTVSGDDARLRQVFANLLSNALTHTPPGTPVTVRLGADEGWAELEVSDRGPGLAAEQAAHVFEPFYRADPSRGRAHADGAEDEGEAGAGLGLSIVVAIAETHGGSVAVTSEPGEGATFVVRLPIALSA